MFVVKMTSSCGEVEWYSSLSVRAQAEHRKDARQFSTREAAQKAADFCLACPDAFSGAYYDNALGRYTMQATVEPL